MCEVWGKKSVVCNAASKYIQMKVDLDLEISWSVLKRTKGGDAQDIDFIVPPMCVRQVSLFFSESPTNPYLRCIDIELVSRLCHAKGALVCIDGTFATPVNQKVLALGADLVLHSATKYYAGHNDVSGQTGTGLG